MVAALWRPTTADERRLIALYKQCSFAPATVSKRFARDLQLDRITDKQMAFLRRMVFHYRKQIPISAIPAMERRHCGLPMMAINLRWPKQPRLRLVSNG